MTLEQLESQGLMLLKCRSGSHAYGLATPTSDEDFRGVFFMPKKRFYGLHNEPQVADEKNDQTYYELGRFLELLAKANPTALEVLATQGKDRIYCHPLLADLRVEDFLSQACSKTFAGYAQTQIRKAKGLNKKVHKPLPKTRKRVEDFCYVLQNGKSISLRKWAKMEALILDNLGLVAIDHTRGVYALFHDPNREWAQGISRGAESNEVVLSSVPKTAPCLAYLSFNKDAYSIYCKQHRDYWDWVEKRNDDRYLSTLAHGQGYDAKNMMHTIRLLDMAIEIFRDGMFQIKRPDRAFLLQIKMGHFTLEEVLKMAEDRLQQLQDWTSRSDLPERVEESFVEDKLVKLRLALYA